MTAGVVKHWLDSGKFELPLPGSGATAQRWQRLGELAHEDLVAARIAMAHTDAVAILDELGGKPVQHAQLWAVWDGADAGDSVTAATTHDGAVTLSGTKQWCPGASFCTHALVAGTHPDGTRGLFAVSLWDTTVRALPSEWANPGMAGSDTRAVRFTNTSAVPVGDPDGYRSRPGFCHRAIGAAACWFGGARAVAEPLYELSASGAADEHALVHLGAVDAALAGAGAVLGASAGQIDADPFDRAGQAELLARRVRAVVADAVDETIDRVGRALGPVQLCRNEIHARRVADLSIYVRQIHPERELAALGALVAPAAPAAPAATTLRFPTRRRVSRPRPA
ncbi:acyl-CoA dehydrogenase [Mycolicibacterium sp.]|uniref:acyl-CoA dehydrogenase n=1 Tax=Mycolicibacterium sp. TaxID=2320850 RepID=UPI00356050A0